MQDIILSTKFYRWLFLLICLSSWKKLADSKEVRIICYYTNWSVYRPGEAKFSPQNINPYLCTHLVYAFGGFTKENTLKPFDKYQDIEKGGYAKFTGLKTYNKNLKTLIAIGGWNEGSSRFSPMVASAERRKELVKNTVKFLRQNHFDGLDLDWEYPTFRDGGKSRDRDNYAQLVKELREEFDRESEKTGRSRLLLTMAVPAGIEYINKGYDVPKLMKYLDWMNILSYDYHSAFEPAVNHHAPLYPLEEESEYNYDTELNIDYTIKHYLENGAIPDKLVLGIPTYGRSYTLFNPEANEMGAPADGPGDMGEATRENGYLAYYEICDYVKNQNWEEVQPNEDAMGPYAFKDNQWVGYDDENIVRKKSEYVAKNNLGGIMFWSIDNDDFRGNCHGRPYPLIEAAKEALLNAYGMTDENLIAPPSKPLKTKSKSRTRTQKTTTTTEASEESVATKSSSRPRRIKTKEKEVDKIVSASSPKRRKTETSSYSSLRVTTPTWTTPAPPATPDMGGAFKCEEEGFFPHPKDCKKYFWCLAGAGDSGIVAHQFTCPAGLYFNKAADSCDYTQNVLCNKKLQKTTTAAKTTTTEGSSSSSSTTSTTSRSPILSGLFSTTRVPPKTPVTSRTTFVGSNTAAAEEEYDDEEYEDEEESDKKSSEEDPQVIKELIELIRKAGGIDQLEKHLKIGGSEGVIKPDSTTQPGLSKSLYERVLNKTSQSTLNALRKNTGTIRNSAGPQNEGLGTNKEKLSASDKGRIQYQNIARKRPTTEKFIDEEVKNEYVSQAEKEKSIPNRAFRPKNSLEYVNIRRPKSGPSTTEANEEDEDSEFTRNKILGESSNEQTDDTSEEKSHETNRKSNSVPKYVNIRRQRPSTTESSVIEEKEASTTSKYVSIRRSTTPSSAGEKDEQELSEKSTRETTTKSGDELFKTTRYQTISRTSTTSSINEANRDLEEAKRSTSKPVIEENSDSKYQVIDISTTASLDASLGSEKYDIVEQNIITKLDDESISLSSTEEEPITTIAQKKSQNNLESSSESVKGRKRPSLFRPRPFSVGTSSSTTEPAVETTKKESIATQRPLFLVGARRRNSTLYFTSTTPTTLLETTRTTKIQSNAAANVENSNNFKNPRISLRKPIKNTFLYSSRTTESSVVSSTTARPASTRVTKYYSRRKVNSSRTTKPVESQVSTITTSSPRVNSRFRFVSRKPTFIRTRPQKKVNESLHLNPDQNIESSNQQSLEEEIRNGLETSDLTDAVNALQKIKNASTPIPKRPQKIRTTIMHTSNFSTSEKIKQATLKPTKVSQEELTLQNNSDKETKDGYSKVTDTPTTNKIEISTFRRTLKPKLTFKQTPAYQEVLNSQEDERQSNTKRKTKTSQISLSNKQPAFKETTNFNLKESKPPLRYKEPAGEQEFTNFNIKEPRPEYFIENTGFSKSSTPKSNLIFNEVPIIIPVISSSYLKKSHLQNNNDFNILYQNTNLDPFKRFEDFSPTTISQNQRETYGDSNFKEFSLNIPIVAPSSKGYFRSTTSKSLSRVATSRVPFRSSTAKPIEIEYSEDSMTAAPVVGASERPITEEFLKKYSVPYVKPNKSRFTTQQPFVIVTPTLRKDRIQRKKERPIQAFEKLSQSAESNTYKSLSEYDYYDDLEASIFGRIPEHSKVLLHTNGGIECLDQGNFPHPVSCKKFIQCAKMENGKVYGWEYTCPKNLSFDPIGGMCNWSAGLGCNE